MEIRTVIPMERCPGCTCKLTTGNAVRLPEGGEVNGCSGDAYLACRDCAERMMRDLDFIDHVDANVRAWRSMDRWLSEVRRA